MEKLPMTPARQLQQESHVRWFGRSEDDPNRLLIIEDDHSRVFLDAAVRAELYAVIDASRATHTSAPAPEPKFANEDNGVFSFPPPVATGKFVTKEQQDKRDAQVAKAEREQYAEELKKDLESRFISSSNQWSKGRNSGLIECCNIIDESLRQPEPQQEGRR